MSESRTTILLSNIGFWEVDLFELLTTEGVGGGGNKIYFVVGFFIFFLPFINLFGFEVKWKRQLQSINDLLNILIYVSS